MKDYKILTKFDGKNEMKNLETTEEVNEYVNSIPEHVTVCVFKINRDWDGDAPIGMRKLRKRVKNTWIEFDERGNSHICFGNTHIW